MAIVECVPNVSEGRRPEVIEACAASIRASGASLLDVHVDASHNRSVFTFAGEPATITVAVLALFDTAIPLIDLRSHTGVHPRIGAVDVVPFVPIAGVTLDACAAQAREVAAEIARRHALPVFLYEAAATRPERRRLEAIRHGEFEGLAARLATAEWTPDFGPSHPHPSAGATVVGARPPLIAFNVNLTTDRVDIARAIARAIRESAGGLRCVKALGLGLAHRGVAQVSMNLTDYTVTSMHDVFDRIRAEAGRHGIEILDSEVVGLVPSAALESAAAWYLKIAGFDRRQVLEHRLDDAHLQR